MINNQFETKCPRCGEGRLRGWNELSDEERMLVQRLPGSADYTPAEREAMHRWCVNCGYEETENEPFDA
jgi:uncharacterized protein (DUF983 family)